MTRAVVGGIAFAILAAGANLLLVRLFPEMFESDSFAAAPDGAEQTGGQVDITIPAEGPSAPNLDVDDRDSGMDTGGGSGRDVPEAADSSEVGEDNPADSETPGDLDRFSAAFAEADDDNHYAKPASDVPGSDHDPQEIAQAIHTVLKRDEKG